MQITRFEDIEGWKEARILGQMIIKATGDHLRFTDANLIQQIRNCVDSAMSNISEGFDSGSDKEFIRFLKMAYRSVSELQSHFYFALDSHFVGQDVFESVYQQAKLTKARIGGFMRYLRRPRPKAIESPEFKVQGDPVSKAQSPPQLT
jgi:four helix bundle protein